MTLRNIAASMRHPRAARLAVAAGNVLATSALIGFVACSDNGVTEPAAPKATIAAAPAARSGPHADLALTSTSWTQNFTYIASTGTTVYFPGGAKVILPANAVCNTSSGYGVTTWNQTCTPVKDSIRFHVVAGTTASGNAGAIVTPDVRFVPGKIAQVYLPAPNGSSTNAPVIQWCPTGATYCVNEATSDTSMTTAFDAQSKLAHRRIKHFSGYSVNYGRASTTQGTQF